MHALVLLSLFACGAAAPPAAPPEAPPEPPPAAAPHDLHRVASMAEACTPELPEGPTNLVLEAAEGEAWAVTLRISGAETRTHVIDPVAQTCDGAPVTPRAFEPARAIPELIALCWAEAERQGGAGVGGSPLIREQARVSLYQERVTVSFPEETLTTLPTGMDMAVDLRLGRCSRAIMD